MKLLHMVVAFVSAVSWVSVPSAVAQPIEIHQGSFRVLPDGAITLEWFIPPPAAFGNRVLTAGFWLSDVRSAPPLFRDGTRLERGARFAGTRTFQGSGQVYLQFPSPEPAQTLPLIRSVFHFSTRPFVAPEFPPPPPPEEEDIVFLQLPFRMQGNFAFMDEAGRRFQCQVRGDGRAFLALIPDRATGEWVIESLSYVFEPDAQGG